MHFIAKHNTCIKKPEASGCGRGIEIIKDITEDLFEKLRDERVVLEEIVHSHEEIRKFNATSLNTVRVITFLTDSGCIPYRAYFRIGRYGAIVDNCHGGGMGAKIDINSGIVITPAYSTACEEFIYHPDSKKMIVGYQIPMWNELMETVIKLANSLPTLQFIGWDMALTNDRGWVLIEANNGASLSIIQQFDGRGLFNEIESFYPKMKRWN